MEHRYEPERWHELFLMLGTSATALVGLLFVVLTIHLHSVERDRDFQLRSRNNTYHLLNVFVLSSLGLVPQPATYFGVEVALICLFALRLPIGVAWNFRHQYASVRQGKRSPAGLIVSVIFIYLLGIAGGAALIDGSGWGLPLVATSSVLLVIRTVMTAWGLMFGLRPGDTSS